MDLSSSKQRTFEFGEFQLDARILRFRGERVPLQPKAIDTLLALVEQAGTVVDKNDLMERVWPDTFVVESSLQRNISVLRKTLEERGGEGPYIETISRRGYRFVRDVTVIDRPQPTPASLPSAEAAEESGETLVAATPTPPRRSSNTGQIWAIALGAALAVLTGVAIYSSRPTTEPEPAAPFRIGSYLLDKRSPAEARRAVDWFQQAILTDPNDAESHAALAQSYLMLASMASAVGGDIGRARNAAERALELDPNSAYAHAVLGQIYLFHDYDVEAAEQTLARAVDLDPRSEVALANYGRLLHVRGRGDEAIRVFDRLQELNPLAAVAGVQKGRVYYARREFSRAIGEFQKVLELERSDTLANYYLALSYGFLAEFELAETHLAQAALQPGVLRTDRAWLSLRQGDPEPMRLLYRELRNRVEQADLSPVAILIPAVALGDFDYAISAIEQTIPGGDQSLINMHNDPRLGGLHDDPRYTELVDQLGVLDPSVR